MSVTPLPPWVVLDPLLNQFLREDIGRGDRTTQSLCDETTHCKTAVWKAKAEGVVAGLPIAKRVFQLLNSETFFKALLQEGTVCSPGDLIAEINGPLDILLTGERVALNLAMHLSGIATLTRQYCDRIADLPAQLVDTRKTTPGLRMFEKYATCLGGAQNHRMGLDDAVMLKDNHIAAVGGIHKAFAKIRGRIPYPLSIEVETESLEDVREAVTAQADIIMLDNMSLEMMRTAVTEIRTQRPEIKIEASGNITLETIRAVAETGVDYISTSAPITQSSWLDLSMKLQLV